MGNVMGMPGGTGQMMRLSNEGKDQMSNSPNNSATVNMQMQQQQPQRFMAPGTLGFGPRSDVNKALEHQHHQLKQQMHPHHVISSNPSQVARLSSSRNLPFLHLLSVEGLGFRPNP